MLSKDDQTKLIESQLMIADALAGIKDNLQKINDQNVLHTTSLNTLTIQAGNDHQNIIEKLKLMTDKYWWLIISLIVAVCGLAGYKFIFQGA